MAQCGEKFQEDAFNCSQVGLELTVLPVLQRHFILVYVPLNVLSIFIPTTSKDWTTSYVKRKRSVNITRNSGGTRVGQSVDNEKYDETLVRTPPSSRIIIKRVDYDVPNQYMSITLRN